MFIRLAQKPEDYPFYVTFVDGKGIRDFPGERWG
jgi:hypothetical protein